MTEATIDRLEHDRDRALLINVAYRLLGSMVDAEDATQETYVRWYRMAEAERDAIRAPAAWCVRVATRICLDKLTSAPRRRETYVGPWLPEPVPGPNLLTSRSPTDPAELVAIDEDVTMAMLVLLESMTPAERVCFVLRDMFSVPFSEISVILGRSEAACRQLAVSARRRIGPARRSACDRRRHDDTAIALAKAFQRGDIEALVGLLAPNVNVTNDGGGKVRAALRPIVGAERVLRYLTGIRRAEADMAISIVEVNGQTGLRMRRGDQTIAVAALEVHDGLITQLWVVRNSDKLTCWDAEAA